ncbi:MAG TPA: Dyp-type peroxidase [Gaiellaceae bacterium]|jgi:putative iron-dependent peroxidase
MRSPQSGIFALGTASHAYLELRGENVRDLVSAVAGLREPRTTMGGVNLVAGFRPDIWPEDAPDGLHGFDADVGFMPATQQDAVLWLSGASYDVVFDVARAAIAELAGVATVAEETSSWPYQHDRDLTGFIDGTENPTLVDAPEFVVVPDGKPGAGGTILLLQKWPHDVNAWESLSVEEQELVIGRRKTDSEELEDKPADSHVASTDQDTFGHIFRRNMPYGTVTEHGTMFVGFCNEQRPLEAMLESMAGLTNGTPDALTRFSKPVTGAYYFVPSTDSLRALGSSATAL